MESLHDKQESPSFSAALAFWAKLGFISFGGPAGQISIMHEHIVSKKRWLSEKKFLHALNYCMLLPGPEAQQLATYIGWLFHGIKGGLAAGILFVLPSTFILWGLSALYVTHGASSLIAPIFIGLKPAVVAVVILALWRMATRALKRRLDWGIAALSFIAIFAVKIPFPAIIFTALMLGLLQSGICSKWARVSWAAFRAEINFMILARKSALFIFLWAAPVLLALAVLPNPQFWLTLCLLFTKAALVTFGGAYAVLPYVAQVSVGKLHWLSQAQMIDGLALGETTPGPLIMVLAFVGFLGGYNTFAESLFYGAAALWLTVFYTFLPSFFFIFVGAPLIERTSNSDVAMRILAPVSAAVVGVVLNLACYFAQGVLMLESGINYTGVAWVVVSMAVLSVKKSSLLLWLAISCGFGYLSVAF